MQVTQISWIQRCFNWLLFALLGEEDQHLIEQRVKLNVRIVKVCVFCQALLQIQDLFLNYNNLLPQFLDFVLVFEEKAVGVDHWQNGKYVILLDLLHGISIKLKTVELETENFGQLRNPSRLFSLNFAAI